MKKYFNVSIVIFSFYLIIFGNSAYLFAGDPMPRIEMPLSSPNPVGSGARALGMGGAFIAVADDATAASWNPGGLIQLEKPEISIVGATFHRIEDNTFSHKYGASGKQSVADSQLNYLSVAYPFTLWGRDMIVSVSYQNLYNFTRNWDFNFITPAKQNQTSQNEDWSIENVTYNVNGSLSALGIAYCIQITPYFSFGFTLNFWEDWLSENEWKVEALGNESGMKLGNKFTKTMLNFDKYSLTGFNSNFGILWNVTSSFTIGAVLKTPFEADVEYEYLLDSCKKYPELSDKCASKTFDPYNENMTMDMPMSFGIGFAYRFSDRFTVSFDIYRTEWDDFVLTDSTGTKTSPITGKSVNESGIDPTHQIRMGAEYIFIKPKYEIPLCAGIFYDSSPAEGSPDNFFGFSVGSGIGIGRSKFDIAYQYRFGNNVGDSVLKGWGSSQDMQEHVVYSSVIIYF